MRPTRAQAKLRDGCLALTVPQKEIIHHGILVNVGRGCVTGYLIEDDREVCLISVDIGETVLVLEAKKGIVLYDGKRIMMPRNCIIPL